MRFALAGCAIEPPPSIKQPLADPRDWTAADGQEFVAEFIERTGDSVRLRTVDGEIVVPLDSLAEGNCHPMTPHFLASRSKRRQIASNARGADRSKDPR